MKCVEIICGQLIKTVLPIFLLVFLCSCATHSHPSGEVARNIKAHSVLLNREGRSLDPLSGELVDSDIYEQQISAIGNRINSYKNGTSICGQSIGAGKGKQRIVIYAHGGLNSKKASINNARKYAEMMLSECIDPTAGTPS